MRLWSWLKPKLVSLGKAAKGRRVNARAVIFLASCWLVWSGVRDSFSPAAARIVLGTVFIVALIIPERKQGSA